MLGLGLDQVHVGLKVTNCIRIRLEFESSLSGIRIRSIYPTPTDRLIELLPMCLHFQDIERDIYVFAEP